MHVTGRAFLALVCVTACSSEPKPVRGPSPAALGAATAPSQESASAATTEADAAEAAPAALTCKTVRAAAAPGYCGVLERAPRAEGEAVRKTVEIWKRLERPFHALTGRETALVVLSAEARIGEGEAAKPIPPAAYICPGAPPTVYVPGSLLALVDDHDPSKYPQDFLAFVMGHELGHRMNDLTPDGCQLAAFQRPGKGVHEEELADARSAFFITSAGFSASKVAREDMVSQFLEAEYALRREDSRGRRDALLGALQRFDSYEALYQAGLAVALTGQMEAADRLLSWADELVQSHGVPLPELRVVRAITRINRAASMAPWLAELGLPVAIDQLRCTPLHPGHSGLWEEPAQRVRSPDIERGRVLLKEALALLAEAEARGATPFTVAAARACASLYLADAAAAEEEQARAEHLLPAGAHPAVRQVLADNRALVTFLRFAKQKPAPPVDRSAALQAWADELAAAVGGGSAPAALVALVASLRDPDAPAATRSADTPACAGAAATHASTTLAPLPAPASAHGACPVGYRLAHALPSLDAVRQTGSTQGVSVCQADSGSGELVTVRLAGTTEPPLAPLERTMLSSPPPAALGELAAWACHCTRLERHGVSDRGEVVYRARCPALRVEHGVLVVDGGRVVSIIQHSR